MARRGGTRVHPAGVRRSWGILEGAVLSADRVRVPARCRCGCGLYRGRVDVGWRCVCCERLTWLCRCPRHVVGRFG